jgi:hypothetical protein
MSKTAELMLELAKLANVLQAAETLAKHGVLPEAITPKHFCKAYVDKTPVLRQHIASQVANKVIAEELHGKGKHKPTGFYKANK